MTDAAPGRILWVNHFAITPSQGGGTRHFELGRALSRRGWSVTIAAADFHLHSRAYTHRRDAADRRVLRESIGGVEFLWLWSAPYRRNNWRRALNWITFAHSLVRLQLPPLERPDLIVGSTPHLIAAAAAARLASRWGVPFVLEVRDLWPESLLAAGGRKGPAYLAFDLIARHLYRFADRVITLARGTNRYLAAERGVSPERMVYVPNGIDPDEFGEPEQRTGDALVFIYTGAHGPANALDTVLDAATRLRHRTDVRFRFVGDGPAKVELIEKARSAGLDNVEFRDPVPKADIPALLAQADVGLMVLRDTPLFAFGVSPNKLFDYLAAGLPVVCNVPGEVQAMIEEAGAGELAAAGSAEALAEAVERMADASPDERRRMGRSGRAWVMESHSRPMLAERLDALFRERLRY